MAERIYNVPLRKEFLKVPRTERSKKAVIALKGFLRRHMKVSTVKLSKPLNEAVWQHGIRNPPHHIKVRTEHVDDLTAKAWLFSEPKEEPEEKGKKAKKKETPSEEKKTGKETAKTEKNAPGTEEKKEAKIASADEKKAVEPAKAPEAKQERAPAKQEKPAPSA